MECQKEKVLCVGLCCLDIVMFCKSYPLEDSDQRCLSHAWQRGGNASNNCTVFAEFKVPCEILGTMSYDIGGQFIKKNFQEHGISFEHCPSYEQFESPTSTIWINSHNGSRTIVHSNKNMPEISLEDFKLLNLNNYSWIHFECRPQFKAIKEMIYYTRQWNENLKKKLKISIEIEKPRQELKEVLTLGDIVFISKDFSMACGYPDMITAVNCLSEDLREGAIIICAWGEKGACGKSKEGPVHTSPAFNPPQVINTLGAGDTFVAATIMAFLQKYDLPDAINRGCQVAGAKCGMPTVSGLSKMFPHLVIK